MKNINYKYTTLVLVFVLIVTYAWHWNCIFMHKSNTDIKMGSMNMSGMNMGNKNTHMMQMPDGSIMEMANGSMNMNNSNQSMDNMMMDMTMGMKGKSGVDLEKVFLSEMIVHHQGAVDMAKALLADKTIKPQLRTFAERIIAAQNPEIQQMGVWLKSY